ncbi:hypothetical protein DMC30DRAFT_412163 [Rhodotorula diobovata]|uniref:Uncharacterized protein n=1 Tax=Rhodotorula diobovata TaxID=5288 RepID=A0A5C5FS19_9BASI|nr:hypothetical protein DMC30DRAFT_412163 [Rhodotorula diobovata]
MAPVSKSERQLRREEPLPDVKLTAPAASAPEPSLAATKPHVAPDQATKAKTKRAKSSASNKRKQQQKEAAIERAQKLEKRKDSVGGKLDTKKKARQMWQ